MQVLKYSNINCEKKIQSTIGCLYCKLLEAYVNGMAPDELL